jgi:hypothetical protein
MLSVSEVDIDLCDIALTVQGFGRITLLQQRVQYSYSGCSSGRLCDTS